MAQKYPYNTSIKYKEQATKEYVVMIPLLVLINSIDNILRPKKKKTGRTYGRMQQWPS